jgi:hypothetical protein
MFFSSTSGVHCVTGGCTSQLPHLSWNACVGDNLQTTMHPVLKDTRRWKCSDLKLVSCLCTVSRKQV